jgi:hypothetical protein
MHAAGILAEELRRQGWREAELERRAKENAQKVRMAVRLRADTALTGKWIAEHLRMSAPGYVNHLPYLERQKR